MQHTVAAGAEDSPSHVPASLRPPGKHSKMVRKNRFRPPSSFQLITVGVFFAAADQISSHHLGKGRGQRSCFGSCELSAGVGESQEFHGVSLATVLCSGVWCPALGSAQWQYFVPWTCPLHATLQSFVLEGTLKGHQVQLPGNDQRHLQSIWLLDGLSVSEITLILQQRRAGVLQSLCLTLLKSVTNMSALKVQ